MDWQVINKDLCCIDNVYNDIEDLTYFPVVKNGELEMEGLATQISDLAVSEMRRYYPNATVAWSYLMFLLKTSMCYVEYTGYNGQLRKMILCSNMNILRECRDFNVANLNYHVTDATNLNKYNGTHLNGGMNTELKAVKINKKLITELKTPILLKGTTIRVAPLCLMLRNAAMVLSRDGITRYNYYKDNGSLRSLVSTKDRSILIKHYTSEKASEMLDGASLTLDTLFNRGYIRIVELGASKYDSGVRAINVAKIKSAEEISDDEVDYRFVDVEFDTIVDTFKYHLERQSDIELLNKINGDFNENPEHSESKPYILNEIFKKVDSNVTYGSTQYLRQLYLYMADRPEIFGASVTPTFDINMGVSDINISDGGIFTFEDMADLGVLGDTEIVGGTVGTEVVSDTMDTEFVSDTVDTEVVGNTFNLGISDIGVNMGVSESGSGEKWTSKSTSVDTEELPAKKKFVFE